MPWSLVPRSLAQTSSRKADRAAAFSESCSSVGFGFWAAQSLATWRGPLMTVPWANSAPLWATKEPS